MGQDTYECDKKQSGHVHVSEFCINGTKQDLKDAETNLVVVNLFKYSMVSICFHIR